MEEVKTQISEQDFFKLSNALYNSLTDYRELEKLNDNSQNEELEKVKYDIYFFVSELIDRSNGFIKTDDKNIKELFESLFKLARGVKQHAYYISHLRNTLKNSKNNSELDKIAEQLYINNKLFKRILDDAYNLTARIQEYRPKQK